MSESETATVSGRITHTDGTLPVESAQVNAYLPATETEPNYDPVVTTVTDETGRYVLPLEPGTYVLEVVAERQQFETAWLGSPDNTRESAELLTITQGQRVTRNHDMLTWRAVDPSIRNDGFSLSYPDNAYSLFYYLFDPSTGTWGKKTSATRRVAWGYVLPKDGRYRLLVEPTYTTTWLPTFYGDTQSFDEARDVFVVRGSWSLHNLSIDVVMSRQLRTLTDPTLSGSGWAGETLVASMPAWEVAPSTWTFSWVRDDGREVGTGSTYVPTNADGGHRVRWEVTGHAPNYEPVTVKSGEILIRSMRVTRPPKIKGARVAGSKLRAKALWNYRAASSTYQWYRDRRAIRGATSATYRTRVADVEAQLSVRVTATTAEGHVGTAQMRTSMIKARSTIRVKRRTFRSGGLKRTEFGATLRIPGCCERRVGGRPFIVTVGRSHKRVGSGRHVHRTTIWWRTPKKAGNYTYHLRFLGSSRATRVTRKVRVRVR